MKNQRTTFLDSPKKVSLAAAFFSLFLLGIMGCGSQEDTTIRSTFEAEFPHTPTYHIFVPTFADSNGDGIGDFGGIIAKLGYLEQLGIKKICLSPVFTSSSFHKYDVSDYYTLASEYGSEDDFRRLLDSAHARHMKVIIDFTVNRTAYSHPWFIDARQDTASPYRNFYIWAAKGESTSQPASAGTHGWISTPTGDYFAKTQERSPLLNFDNSAVKDSIKAIAAYMMDSFAIDGFRLDEAHHIFTQDSAEKATVWWQEFSDFVKAKNKNFLLVGDVWGSDSTIAPYFAAIESNFNWDVSLAIKEAVYTGTNSVSRGYIIHQKGQQYATSQKFTELWQQTHERYSAVNADYIDALLLTNYRQSRLMSDMEGSTPKAKLCATILYSLPGTPYIYSGDEIGILSGTNNGTTREAMLWAADGADNFRTHGQASSLNTTKSVAPVDLQIEDENSLLRHYMALGNLRNSSRALTLGALEPLKLEDASIIAFVRTAPGEQVIVLHNISESSRTLDVGDIAKITERNLLYATGGSSIKAELGKVTLSPRSSLFIRL